MLGSLVETMGRGPRKSSYVKVNALLDVMKFDNTANLEYCMSFAQLFSILLGDCRKRTEILVFMYTGRR